MKYRFYFISIVQRKYNKKNNNLKKIKARANKFAFNSYEENNGGGGEGKIKTAIPFINRYLSVP